MSKANKGVIKIGNPPLRKLGNDKQEKQINPHESNKKIKLKK